MATPSGWDDETVTQALKYLRESVDLHKIAISFHRLSSLSLTKLVDRLSASPSRDQGTSPAPQPAPSRDQGTSSSGQPNGQTPGPAPRSRDRFGWLQKTRLGRASHKLFGGARALWRRSPVGKTITRAVRSRATKVFRGLATRASGVAGSASGKAIVGAARGVLSAGAAAGGAALGVAGGLVAVGAALHAFYKAVTQASSAALDSYKKYAEVSGAMAAVMSQRDIAQLRRDIRFGEATAKSAGALAAAESKRKDQETRIDIVLANAKNNILAFFEEKMAKPLEYLANALEWIMDNWPFGGGKLSRDPPATGTVFGDIAALERSHDRIRSMGRSLLDLARDAASRGAGTAAPGGAAPLGRGI